MLYSSSPTWLTEKSKQTSSTATFNQTQPDWRPFLTSKGTSAVQLVAEFVWMRDTFPSNEVNHITSAPKPKQGLFWCAVWVIRLTLSFQEWRRCIVTELSRLKSDEYSEWVWPVCKELPAEKLPSADTVELQTSILFRNHVNILSTSHFAHRGSAVKCKWSR